MRETAAGTGDASAHSGSRAVRAEPPVSVRTSGNTVMLRIRNSCTSVALLTMAFASSSAAQSGEIKATYPFGASQAVASDPALDLVFAGLGSGVMLLDGSTDQPTPYDPGIPGTVENRLRPEGFVREMATTDDHLYLAAGNAGLVRYDRNGNYGLDWRFFDPLLTSANVPEAWALSVDRIQGLDYILLGTHDHGDIGGCPTACDDDGTGTLFLLSLDPNEPNELPSILHSVNLDAPIYAVESMIVDDTLTVLVGTACRQVGSGGTPQQGLLRYDWGSVSTTLPATIPGATATWAAQYAHTTDEAPTFVRDIVIDTNIDNPGEDPIAYVAAFSRGLHKIDLSIGVGKSGLESMLDGFFPIVMDGSRPGLFHGLALYEGVEPPVVVASLGARLHEEMQVWGACANAQPCDDLVVAGSAPGLAIRLYEGATGEEVGHLDRRTSSCQGPQCGTLLPSDAQPFQVAVRPDGPGRFPIDTAADSAGVLTLEALDQGSATWALSRVGTWGKEHPGIGSGSMDGLLALGESLYVGVEGGLIALRTDLDPMVPSELDQLLDDALLPYVDEVAAILLEGFVDPWNPDLHVILGRGLEVVSVMNATADQGVATSIVKKGAIVAEFPTSNPKWRGYGVGVLPPGQSPDPNGWPWVVVANASDNQTTVQGCGGTDIHGGVHVYRLQSDLDGDPSDWDAGEATLLASWVPTVCVGGVRDTDPYNDGYWTDAAMIPTADPNVFAIYVSFGPRDLEYHAGLMVLRATFDPFAGSSGELSIEFDHKVYSFLNLCDPPPPAMQTETVVGLIAYPLGTANRLGVALGCHGVAVYDVSEPFNSGIVSAWSNGDDCDAGSLTALHIAANPGNTDTAYVTFINQDIGGVGALNLITHQMSPLTPTPFNANTIVPAEPSVVGQPAFFVADGRGGVHYVQFQNQP